MESPEKGDAEKKKLSSGNYWEGKYAHLHPRGSDIEPAIRKSLRLIGPGCWSIGSCMFVEILKDGEEMPPDTVSSWNDSGATYFLRKRSPPRVDKEIEGEHVQVYENWKGHSRGIWNFSPNVFIKVKGWVEGITTEATTIRWVNKHVPSVPTEEIIYDWIDAALNRTIMFTKRVSGQTYQKAWAGLTIQQRLHVADEMAAHKKALSEMTSDHVETVDGNGIQGRCLTVSDRKIRLPQWKPRVGRRVSLEEYRTGDYSGNPVEEKDSSFVLQHPDCSPENFLVTTPSDPDQMPKITAIIDWERVGYEPIVDVALEPRTNQVFGLDSAGGVPTLNMRDWQWMLSNACVRVGFPLDIEDVKAWGSYLLRTYAPDSKVEYLVNLENYPPESV